MRGISKLGVALLLVFILSVVAVSAGLLFLSWRRRSSRRDSSCTDARDGDRNPIKHPILCFLCWKHRFRREPAASVAPAASPDASPQFTSSLGVASPKTLAAEADAVDEELAKWRRMYASRFLFTIGEDEREGVESEAGESLDIEMMGTTTPSAIEEAGDSPSSTPCSSPVFFYTPPSSPLVAA